MSEETQDKPIINKEAHGRGTSLNPANRFEEIEFAPDPEFDFSEDQNIKTKYYIDASKSLINYNDSPDVGFDAGINPYRGCEHGCIYCFARPSHEYLGLSSGLDFETKIFVKTAAPALLRKELSAPKWQPKVLALSGNTDCYQPIERRLKITRGCLEILLNFRNPCSIITKNRLITRDIDILKSMSEYKGVAVFISMTTLDVQVAKLMEPRTSIPEDRLRAIEELRKNNIPVGSLIAPVIPALTDHEIPTIIKAVVNAGAQFAGYTVLRLPYSVKDLFEDWLLKNFPERKDKILNRLRSLRGGKLYDAKFGERMKGSGIWAKQIKDLFRLGVQKAGILLPAPELSVDYFRNPYDKQLKLF